MGTRTETAVEHEEGLRHFISPEWRRRFRDGLASEKQRPKVVSKLAHFNHLDYRFATNVKSAEQNSNALGVELRRRGAGDRCQVVSEDPDIDGLEMSLSTALEAVVDRSYATFVSCIPGKLAYFHDEEIEQRFILDRSTAAPRPQRR